MDYSKYINYHSASDNCKAVACYNCKAEARREVEECGACGVAEVGLYCRHCVVAQRLLNDCAVGGRICEVDGCDVKECGIVNSVTSLNRCTGCDKLLCLDHELECENEGCGSRYPWCEGCLVPCTVEGCINEMCDNCALDYGCHNCGETVSLCHTHQSIREDDCEKGIVFCSDCTPSPENIKGD